MAFRTPLKVVGSGAAFSLQKCTAAEITQVVDQMIRKYGQSPSATLAVGSGNLGNITDTRLQAGAGTTDATNFDTTSELGDVSTVTVTLNKIVGAFHGTSAPTISALNDQTYGYPLYADTSSTVREMNITDMVDTFWHPAAERLTTASISNANSAGTYTISTATSVTNHTLISSTPVFTDTRANASAYTAAGISETQDQPTTITNYYLHRVNETAAGGAVMPFLAGRLKSETQPRIIPRDIISNQLQAVARFGAINESNYRIQYRFAAGASSGFVTRATAIDTKLNSSAYITNEVYVNDYRAQEVPAGSATTIATYNFQIKKT